DNIALSACPAHKSLQCPVQTGCAHRPHPVPHGLAIVLRFLKIPGRAFHPENLQSAARSRFRSPDADYSVVPASLARHQTVHICPRSPMRHSPHRCTGLPSWVTAYPSLLCLYCIIFRPRIQSLSVIVTTSLNARYLASQGVTNRAPLFSI